MYLLLGVLAQIGLLIAIINSYQKDLRRLKLELDYSNCYLEEAKKQVESLDKISQKINSLFLKEVKKNQELETAYQDTLETTHQDIKDIMEIWIGNYSWLEHEKHKAIDQLEEVINWKEDYILNLEDKVEEYEEQIAILKEQVNIIADLNNGEIKM